MIGKTKNLTATIDVSESTTVSSAVENYVHGQISGLIIPGTFTGTSVTFQGSYDGDTYTVLYLDGADYSMAVDESRWVVLDPTVFYGVPYVKVVSGSAEGADREITVLTSKVL